MIFWLVIALMTAAVLYALLRPLLGAHRPSACREAHDAAVYRDQMKEIEADRERGLIGTEEAEAARIEIARRLLATDKPKGESRAARVAAGSRTFVLGAIAIGVPAVSLALYFLYGSPGLPDQPLQARLEAPISDQSLEALVARVEARLREDPEDGTGWEVIAPVYMNWRRYDDAADAYGRAIRLLGENAKRLTDYGTALVFANGGVVSEQARQAFDRALVLEPDRLAARFWIATAKEQDGRFTEAAEEWRAMLAQGTEDAPWRKLVEERLAAAAAKASGQAPVTSQPASPSEDEIAAAARLSPAERQTMIEGMVAGLASRLEQNGDDLPGWLKLVRAYAVLSRKEDALKALAKAREQFSDEPQALQQLDNLAKELGLAS